MLIHSLHISDYDVTLHHQDNIYLNLYHSLKSDLLPTHMALCTQVTVLGIIIKSTIPHHERGNPTSHPEALLKGRQASSSIEICEHASKKRTPLPICAAQSQIQILHSTHTPFERQTRVLSQPMKPRVDKRDRMLRRTRMSRSHHVPQNPSCMASFNKQGRSNRGVPRWLAG